jgi:hypothetical protein
LNLALSYFLLLLSDQDSQIYLKNGVNLLALARARRSTSMQVHEVFYQLRPANRMPLCGFIVWQSRLE